MSISYTHVTPAGFQVDRERMRRRLSGPATGTSASITVREATSTEREAWDVLVAAFPGWRVSHTRAWLESLQAAGLGRPLYIVFERGGCIVGCLPGMQSRVGPLRMFGSPLPGWQTVSMGPVFDPEAVSTDEMVTGVIPLLETRYGIHHIEMMSSTLDRGAMEAAGFRGSASPSFRVPLHPGEPGRVLRGMKDSARRNVKRAVRLGLTVREEHDAAFVSEHFDQIGEVFTRRGFALPFSRDRVQTYVEHMHRAGHLLGLAVYLPDGATCIATATFTIAADELVLWMWTHRTEHRWFRPTELMTWTAMQRAMEAGCTSVDFMGRGDFKAQLGATADESKMRWVRSRYAWLRTARDAAEWAYRSQQALRGRLKRSLQRAPAAEQAGEGPDRAASASEATGPVS